MKWLLLVFVAVSALGTAEAMRKQGVAVRGTLMCGSSPADKVKVRIVDIDTGPDPDDTLDEKFTDSTGKFELNGSTRELTDIDPVLYIWHDCLDGQTPCQRKVKLTIPKKFIHGGTPKPEEWIDIGIINLQGSFENEGRECVN
uniref:Transthyretin-like family protein n=1 Tax=Steinernema glaseri TaxID=37863 RepID=A0A1I7YQV6_9BILA